MSSPPLPELNTSGFFFRTSSRRTILLRGVNLGASKSPKGEPSHLEFLSNALVGGRAQWVGLPIDLDEADVHLARLRGWGFNVIRYAVVWEALEWQGPGKYDHEFIAYTVELLKRCEVFGFRVFINPHQDLWSRFSGGSGAPLWTLHACGLDPTGFQSTEAALLHSAWPPGDEKKRPGEFPEMIWTTNHNRLAVLTLFTLFFAGRTYAPKCTIDGQNIQDYLQTRYYLAYQMLARALSDAGLLEGCVMGWDSMNEPDAGYIGLEDLSSIGKTPIAKMGSTPTGIEGMRLGIGQAQTVERWHLGKTGPHKDGHVSVDPGGRRAWLREEVERWGWRRDPGWELGTCVWALHGVWDVETGELKQPGYFKRSEGFVETFWLEFHERWTHSMREVDPRGIIFVQPSVFAPPPKVAHTDNRTVYSAHYYDGLTIMHRHWHKRWNADVVGILREHHPTPLLGLRVGENAVRRAFAHQLAMLASDAREVLGDFPTVIGETGIPMDLDDSRAYKKGGKWEGDWTAQTQAMDAILSGCDASLLNYTIWLYAPYNSHEFGDEWNREDMSIFSADDFGLDPGSSACWTRTELSSLYSSRSSDAPDAGESRTMTDALRHASLSSPLPSPSLCPSAQLTPAQAASALLIAGARALLAFCRPYPLACEGTPTHIHFDYATSAFELRVRVDAGRAECATEVYTPFVHYGAATEEERRGSGVKTRMQLREGKQERLEGEVRDGLARAARERCLDVGELSVEVEVSEGSWDVVGQVLKWTYDAERKEDREVRLKMKRRGGQRIV